MRNVIVLSIALACAGIALGEEVLKEDHVPVENGEKVVEIIGETFAEIECKIGPGATSVIKREDVTGEINYEGDDDLTKVRRALNGDPAECAKQAKALAEKAAQGRTRKIFKQHALWYWAVSLHNGGDLKGAAAKYAELMQEFPKTQYLYSASEKAVECYLLGGDAAGAKAFIGQLQKVNVDDGGKFAVLRDYLSASVDEKGNPSGAKGMYAKVEGAAARFPDVQTKAKVGGARCMLAGKDFAGSEKKFREVADSGVGGLVRLAAWNGVGDVNLAKAEEEKNPANKMPLVKAALMAYLRSAIQYDPGEGESYEEKAKGMAKAGHCFEMYADSFSDATQKAEYKNRARGLYGDCVGQFGSGGGWGAWAAKRMGR
ncbi:MAG: hypothetical protein AAB434_05170 [Planctomycetota bacterium]